MSAAQSFAALATELRGVVPADKAAAQAAVVSLLHFGGGLTVTAGVLRLDSEPVAAGAAGRTSGLLKEFYDIDAPVHVGVVGHLRPVVRVPDEDDFLASMGYDSFDRFSATIANSDGTKHTDLVFHRRGIGWKLTSIVDHAPGPVKPRWPWNWH